MTPSAAADAAATNEASRWIVPLSALIGLALGLVAFAFSTPSYEARAFVTVGNPAGSMNDEVSVVESPSVLDVAEAIVGFRPDISVSAAEVTSRLTITASSDSAQEAAAAANAVAETYVQAQPGAAASVTQPADASEGRTGLGPQLFGAIGALLGALVGFVIGAVQRSRAVDAASPSQRQFSRPSSDDAPPIVGAAAVTAEPVPPSSSPSTSLSDTNPAAPAHPSTITGPMTSSPRTFSDAAAPNEASRPSWLTDPSVPVDLTQLDELDRRALQSQHESDRYELWLSHTQEIPRLTAEHERSTTDLRAEVGRLNKQVRMQAVRLKTARVRTKPEQVTSKHKSMHSKQNWQRCARPSSPNASPMLDASPRNVAPLTARSTTLDASIATNSANMFTLTAKPWLITEPSSTTSLPRTAPATLLPFMNNTLTTSARLSLSEREPRRSWLRPPNATLARPRPFERPTARNSIAKQSNTRPPSASSGAPPRATLRSFENSKREPFAAHRGFDTAEASTTERKRTGINRTAHGRGNGHDQGRTRRRTRT